VRVQVRSSHPYRWAVGTQEADALEPKLLEQGRTASRSPQRTLRNRDNLPHSSKDWERRRSWSPVRHRDSETRDNNSAFSVSPDPIIDTCFWGASPMCMLPRGHDDPMRMEASCAFINTTTDCCYSPDGTDEAPQSSPYVSVSGLWSGPKLPANAVTTQEEIVSGAGCTAAGPGGVTHWSVPGGSGPAR
jgi:hypothetical protein